jgi:DnaJ-class molecular chaperone
MADAYLLNPGNEADPWVRCPECNGIGLVLVRGRLASDYCPNCEGEGHILSSALTADEQADLDSSQEEAPPE